MRAQITHRGCLDMQVCVPATWGDKQIIDFAESENPCGTTHGWGLRREGNKALQGQPERNPCTSRDGCVHVMLDA